MPGGDANSKPIVTQMTDDPTPEKTGPANDSHKLHHGASRFSLEELARQDTLFSLHL
jgi:hypothetical protein